MGASADIYWCRVQHQNEGVMALKKVSALLETAQFSAFWRLFDEDATVSGLLQNFPGFREAIQDCEIPLPRVPFLFAPRSPSTDDCVRHLRARQSPSAF